MKRSEMIKQIFQDLDGSLTENQIISVLHLAECYGMKPPRVSEEDAQAIMHVYCGGYSMYQWDEDLEKDEKVMEAKRKREAARIERSTPEGRAAMRLRLKNRRSNET